MKSAFTILRFFKTLLLIATLSVVNSGSAEELPDPLVSALLFKITEFNLDYRDKKTFDIAVINNPSLAAQIETMVGQDVFNGVLSKVTSGWRQDESLSDIYVVRDMDEAALGELLMKTSNSNVLIVGQTPDMLEKGALLVLFDDEGIPGVLLNVSESRKRRINWSPKLLNFVMPVETGR